MRADDSVPMGGRLAVGLVLSTGFCLLYTFDVADDMQCVRLGAVRMLKTIQNNTTIGEGSTNSSQKLN
ncbi:hypothetical protein, partial [Pseudomonas aeruginosa]|uniref:hypothetical protein n=1 Tax=Pseudomonas aeruginosa TaxID=287 RepID=UPI001C4E8B4A